MTRILALLANEARTLTAALGLALLAVGCWLMWVPLAFVVPGVALTAMAVMGARSGGKAG